MGVVTAVQGKKIFKWGIVVVGGFYLLSRPDDAAQTVHGAFNGMVSAAQSISQFFATLT
jgi:hypothetical protein